MLNENTLDKKAHDHRVSEKFVDRGFMTPSDPLGKILDVADEAIVSVDHEERILLFNQSAERIFGYTPMELVGQSLDILLPSRPVALHRKTLGAPIQLAASELPRDARIKILARRKDGTEFTAEASISTVGVNGGRMFTVILIDITQRLADDKKLQESLREKEDLLREIHHRVKNNLQVVSSLLAARV
jgi:PAS domain S-box-containing protein